jgi:hypothetical protein
MKRGLNVTLMTVAIAVMALQAAALAPVISDIQSPIVGNEASITYPTRYIYPDAFDLDSKVADDVTTDGAILWSYAIIGTPIYRINNVDPMDLGTTSTDDIDAPGAKRLNGGVSDPDDVDGLSNTITIRNLKYTPIGSAETTPTLTGIIDEQVVTFFTSDGTTHAAESQADILFFTDVGGSDRLSGGWPIVYQPDLLNGPVPAGYTYELLIGTVTSSAGANGLCLAVPALGDNFGWWKGAMGNIPLTANTVYRVRARVNGSQSTAGTVPFFDFVIDNYDGSTGLNLYGGDFLILDNEGGANAALASTNGTTYTWVWAPAAVNTAAWNNTTNGVFASGVGANKNARFQFRVLDVISNGGITAGVDLGTLCLNQLTVEAIPYAEITTTLIQENTDLQSSNFYANPLIGGAGTATYAGGDLTIQPNAAAQAVEYAQCYPGDATYDPNTPASVVDNAPIPWQSNKLLKIEFDLSAPDATSETNPFDVFWTSVDTVTNELIIVSYTTGAQNRCGMPKQGAAQQYSVFLYTHNESLSGVSQFHRIRPRIEFGNNAGLVFNTNTGGVRVHGWHVYDAQIPGGNP